MMFFLPCGPGATESARRPYLRFMSGSRDIGEERHDGPSKIGGRPRKAPA